MSAAEAGDAVAAGTAPPDQPSLPWTFEENKAFEVALARLYKDPDRWDKIAVLLPGTRTGHDLQRRYTLLEDDLRKISDGKVLLPQGSPDESDDAMPSKKGKLEAAANGERRKGVPWTEEEHRLFLLGLAKFGKGDWRSIARNYVVSRTPTQVASHAQKYFIRLNTMNKKDKRRASIHDITNAAGIHNANGSVKNGGGAGNPPLQQAGSGSLVGGPGTLGVASPHGVMGVPGGLPPGVGVGGGIGPMAMHLPGGMPMAMHAPPHLMMPMPYPMPMPGGPHFMGRHM